MRESGATSSEGAELTSEYKGHQDNPQQGRAGKALRHPYLAKQILCLPIPTSSPLSCSSSSSLPTHGLRAPLKLQSKNYSPVLHWREGSTLLAHYSRLDKGFCKPKRQHRCHPWSNAAEKLQAMFTSHDPRSLKSDLVEKGCTPEKQTE